jgi:hypothetical protein
VKREVNFVQSVMKRIKYWIDVVHGNGLMEIVIEGRKDGE